MKDEVGYRLVLCGSGITHALIIATGLHSNTEFLRMILVAHRCRG